MGVSSIFLLSSLFFSTMQCSLRFESHPRLFFFVRFPISYGRTSSEERGKLAPGVIPTSTSDGYSHVNVDDLEYSKSDIEDVRFECMTSRHNRKIHFKTNNAMVIGGAFDGDMVNSQPRYWTNFTKLSGHNARLPAATNKVNSETHDFSYFPFFKSDTASAYWNIQHRWDCDDDSAGYDAESFEETSHLIWVRMAQDTAADNVLVESFAPTPVVVLKTDAPTHTPTHPPTHSPTEDFQYVEGSCECTDEHPAGAGKFTLFRPYADPKRLMVPPTGSIDVAFDAPLYEVSGAALFSCDDGSIEPAKCSSQSSCQQVASLDANDVSRGSLTLNMTNWQTGDHRLCIEAQHEPEIITGRFRYIFIDLPRESLQLAEIEAYDVYGEYLTPSSMTYATKVNDDGYTIANERTTDSSIGEGWSSIGVQNLPGYGYVHGQCSDTCGADYGFFGADVRPSKTWKGLPEHSQITVKLRYWYFDSWDGEYGRIYIDKSLAWTSSYHSYTYPTGTEWTKDANICGALGAHYYYVDVVVTVAHTAHKVTVRIEGPDQDCEDESFGFSAFSLEVFSPDGSCPVKYECFVLCA